jgi:hypothetical protein
MEDTEEQAEEGEKRKGRKGNPEDAKAVGIKITAKKFIHRLPRLRRLQNRKAFNRQGLPASGWRQALQDENKRSHRLLSLKTCDLCG